MEGSGASGARRSPSGTPAAYWLIARRKTGRAEVLALGSEGEGKTLPVFSFEEEALLFSRLSGLGSDWRASESGIPDLLAVLAGPRPNARRAALDPIPEIGLHGSHDLVSLPREEFVGLLAVQLLARERRSSTRRGT